MTATYNADNTITEQCQIEKPKKRLAQHKHGTREYYQAIKEWHSYNEQKDQLRTLPCSPECRGLWKPGDQLEEGKDYEVKGAGEWKWASQLKGNVFAAPVAAVKSEDIADRTFSFDETLGLLIDFGNMVLRNRDRLKWDMSNDAAEWLAEQLKKIHHH